MTSEDHRFADALFYIVSVAHTQRRHRYVTVWRPNDAGYAWPLSWAGCYAEQAVRMRLGYYNDGRNNVAVPVAVLDKLAVSPRRGEIDSDAGPVVRNTERTWRIILANVIAAPAYTPRPEYRGAPKSEAA